MLVINTMSHLYKCLCEKISSSMNMTTKHRNKVTTSNLWKRNSVKVINNRILFSMKICTTNDDKVKLDFSFNIWSNLSLITFSFWTKLSLLVKSSSFLSIWKLLSSGDWLNWFWFGFSSGSTSPDPSKFWLFFYVCLNIKIKIIQINI